MLKEDLIDYYKFDKPGVIDKRLTFFSRGGLSFLEWVAIYNNGKPLEYSFNIRSKK